MESETRIYDNIGVCTFVCETCSTNFDYVEVPKITGVHTILVLSPTSSQTVLVWLRGLEENMAGILKLPQFSNNSLLFT